MIPETAPIHRNTEGVTSSAVHLCTVPNLVHSTGGAIDKLNYLLPSEQYQNIKIQSLLVRASKDLSAVHKGVNKTIFHVLLVHISYLSRLVLSGSLNQYHYNYNPKGERKHGYQTRAR